MNEHLVFLDFGSFEIYWYGFLIGSAILTGSLFYCALRRKQGHSFSEALATVIWALPVAFVFSRISYCWFRSASFVGHSGEFLNFFSGGGSLLGALTGLTVVMTVRSRLLKEELLPMLDAASPALSLAIAVGRFAGGTGNEETGFEINTSLSLPFLKWSETDKANLLWIGFFEGIISLVICIMTFALFRKLYRKKNSALQKGCVTLCFMLTYGLSQALLESMKGDSLFMVTLGFVRIDQIFSILIAIAAIVIIIIENCRVCGFSLRKLLLWAVCAVALVIAFLCEFSLNATYLVLIYFCMFFSLAVMWCIAAALFFNTVKTRTKKSPPTSVICLDGELSRIKNVRDSGETGRKKSDRSSDNISIRKMTRSSIEDLIDSLNQEDNT